MHRPERFSARWRRSTHRLPTGNPTGSAPQGPEATSTAAGSPQTPECWSSAWSRSPPHRRPRPGHRRIRNPAPIAPRRPSAPSSPRRCRSGPVRRWRCAGCACAECNQAGSPDGSGRTHRKSPLARQSPSPGSTAPPAGSTPNLAPTDRRGCGQLPGRPAAKHPGQNNSAPAPAARG
ncbi:hypothetical protein D3C84_812940 [compost metagenome]